MASRIELHNILVSILGSRNVYFQPPESIKMIYPCIVYERTKIINTVASNKVYIQDYSYQITAIYKNPDDELPKKLSKSLICDHIRHFVSDGLYHDIFVYKIKNT